MATDSNKLSLAQMEMAQRDLQSFVSVPGALGSVFQAIARSGAVVFPLDFPARTSLDRKQHAAPALYDALESMRDWIKHWQDDKACGLAPTDSSLAGALAECDAVLKLAREG
jgi:hypothetical protein